MRVLKHGYSKSTPGVLMGNVACVGVCAVPRGYIGSLRFRSIEAYVVLLWVLAWVLTGYSRGCSHVPRRSTRESTALLCGQHCLVSLCGRYGFRYPFLGMGIQVSIDRLIRLDLRLTDIYIHVYVCVCLCIRMHVSVCTGDSSDYGKYALVRVQCRHSFRQTSATRPRAPRRLR